MSLLVPEQQANRCTFHQPSHVVSDNRSRQAVLFERGVVHEDIAVAIAVGIDTFVAMYVGRFQRISAAVGLFIQRTFEQVSQFCAIQSLTFARLYEKAFEHFVGLVVDLNLNSLFEFPSLDAAH